MGENTVVITERDGKYAVQNNGIPEITLIGILECLVFEMKSVKRRKSEIEQKQSSAAEPGEIIPQTEGNREESSRKPGEDESIEKLKDSEPETKREVVEKTSAPDLRTRIGNAIRAIRELGAVIEDTDLSDLTEEELKTELEELTSQYKRLKTSKGAK